MMKHKVFRLRQIPLWLCLLLPLTAAAQFRSYPVSNIPDSLLKGAHAVLRQDHCSVVVTQEDKATMTVERVITILDDEAADQASLMLWYSSDARKIKEVTIRLLDQDGKEEAKWDKKDLKDVSGWDAVSVTDLRYLIWEGHLRRFPATVVMKYELELKNLFLMPDWYVQNTTGLAVESSRLEVTIPESEQLRYKSHLMGEAEVTTRGLGGKTLLWQMEQVPALEKDAIGKGRQARRAAFPHLYLIPERFVVEGIEGRSDSWSSMGKFFYDLNDGRQELPAELATLVHEKVDAVTDPTEKIRILYELMQSQTRYVSVQLGIGGFQTFDAKYVYENGFGDCKALTNYMKSLLQEVGIESYWALVNAGNGAMPIEADFPSAQFNHAILCVPREDTIWLECTSQILPFNYLGGFTEDRHVLLLTPEGGHLIKTPASTARDNLRNQHMEVHLHEDGTADVAVTVLTTGARQTDLRFIGEGHTFSEQERYVKSLIPLPSYTLKEFNFSPGESHGPVSYQLAYTVEARNVADMMGSRLFLKPSIFSFTETLRSPARLPNAILDVDSVVIFLPPSHFIEALPEFESFDSVFGSYRAELSTLEPGKLLYVRELMIHDTRSITERSDAFQVFLSDVQKADRQKMVLNNRS